MPDFADIPIWIYVIVGFVIVGIIGQITEYYQSPKCEHGIRNGSNIMYFEHVAKCPECQKQIELKKKQAELEAYHLAKQSEYQELFKTLLKEAVSVRRQAITTDVNTIRQMKPKLFEDLIAVLFRRMGYVVRQTPYINDGGKDAYVLKDGKTYLLECKRYGAEATIGRPMLQKLYAAITEEKADGGFFVATCRFSKDAMSYCMKYHITPVDVSTLMDLLWKYRKDKLDNIQEYKISCRRCGEIIHFGYYNDVESKTCSNNHVVKNVFWNTSGYEMPCPECGSRLILKSGYRGEFYGCSAHPDCYYTIDRVAYEVLIGKRKPYKGLHNDIWID